MKVRVLFLTLFLTICFSVSAQDSYQESVSEYLNVSGSVQEYESLYTKTIGLLKKHFSKSEITEATWKSLQNNKAESMQEIQKVLALAYQNHFSENDIKKMTDFYKTDAGKQVLSNSLQLSAEQKETVANFNNSGIGKMIAKKEKDVSKDVARVLSNWSRDLYMEKINVLKAKGYVPNYEMSETTKKADKGKMQSLVETKSQN